MEQESKIGKIAQGVKNALHKQAIDTAIFWGIPGWAQKEAEALGLDMEQQTTIVQDAIFRAADREELIHGNYKRAQELREKAFGLNRPRSNI